MYRFLKGIIKNKHRLHSLVSIYFNEKNADTYIHTQKKKKSHTHKIKKKKRNQQTSNFFLQGPMNHHTYTLTKCWMAVLVIEKQIVIIDQVFKRVFTLDTLKKKKRKKKGWGHIDYTVPKKE